jgi:uncharacterized protein (TIGR00296 family)
VNRLTKSSNTRVADRLRASLKDRGREQAAPLICWTVDGRVRGYAGSYQPVPLLRSIPQYGVLAAEADNRFSPIQIYELSHTTCRVTLLYHYETARNALDWTLGVHGIRLKIDHCVGMYLPDVPVQRGWTQIETLARLAAESHFPGVYDAEAIARSSVDRFRCSSCSVNWTDYQHYIEGLH